jgi:hypothetical protein
VEFREAHTTQVAVDYRRRPERLIVLFAAYHDGTTVAAVENVDTEYLMCILFH